MKYNVATKKTVAVGAVTESKTLSFEANVKALRVIIDGVYTDKIGAPIRELMTNALDAHIDAGCPERPFEVHLPSAFDPTFRVRDFGCSMSEQVVDDVYSVLFCSTKDQSNDATGMLGIGSKSPYAYGDSFTVICYLDGIVRVYEWGLKDDGTPDFRLMATGPTDEGNGVEVSFHVEDTDFSTFRSKIAEIAMGFDVLPIFVCGSADEIKIPQPVIRGEGFRYYHSVDGMEEGVYIRQGPVVYPIALYSLKGYPEHLGDLFNIRAVLIIDVKIGDCDVTASRDSLAYNTRTIQNVITAMEKVNTQLHDRFLNNINSITNYELACIEWVENRRLYQSVGLSNKWNGRPLMDNRFHKNVDEVFGKIIQGDMDSLKDRMAGEVSKRFNDVKEYNWMTITGFTSEKTTVFVSHADDVKTSRNIIPRIAHYYETKLGKALEKLENTELKSEKFLAIKLNSNIVFDKEQISEMLNGFDVDRIIHMDGLQALKERAVRVVKEKAATGPFFYYNLHGYRKKTDTAPTEGLFLRTRGRSVVIIDGKEHSFEATSGLIEALANMTEKVKKVWVIPKCNNALTEQPGMVCLDDVVIDEIESNYTREKVMLSMAYANHISEYHFREMESLLSKADYKGYNLEYDLRFEKMKSLVNAFKNVKAVGDAWSRINQIYNIFDIKESEVEALGKEFEDLYEEICNDYPMMKSVNLVYNSDSILDYISKMGHYKVLLQSTKQE